MTLKEIMTENVRLCAPDHSLREAAGLMREGDFGLLPVGEDDRLVGTLTDRDIAMRAVAEGLDPAETTVRDIMSEGIRYCYEDQTLEEAAEVMGKAQIRRMPVLSREKRLVGIVSLGDLSGAGPRSAAAQALNGVSNP